MNSELSIPARRLMDEAGQLPEDQRIAVIAQMLAALGRDQGLLHRLLGELVPVRHTADVCGGRACVGDTRIPVWLLVQARQMGTSDARLLDNYPSLTSFHLWSAWSYYADHPAEIEADIEAQEVETDDGE